MCAKFHCPSPTIKLFYSLPSPPVIESQKSLAEIRLSLLFHPLFSPKLSVSVSYKVASYMQDSTVIGIMSQCI